MIAIEILLLFIVSYVFGYVVGRTGNETDANKGRRDIEDDAIAFGYAEITIVDGKRIFKWKSKPKKE